MPTVVSLVTLLSLLTMSNRNRSSEESSDRTKKGPMLFPLRLHDDCFLLVDDFAVRAEDVSVSGGRARQPVTRQSRSNLQEEVFHSL